MIYKVESTLSGYFTDAALFLNRQRIFLGYDGRNQYRSTDRIALAQPLLPLTLRVWGLNGTGWKLNLLVQMEAAPHSAWEFEDQGTIVRRGTALTTFDLALEP